MRVKSAVLDCGLVALDSEGKPCFEALPGQSLPSTACFQDGDAPLTDMVLKAIFDVYPEWRENYKEFLGEELEDRMPELHSPSDLKTLIGLSTIHVLSVERDGLAYVGFEFGCEWEEEHGLGVMLHGNRIIDVGSAEEAFSTSIANKDKSNG